ncbi:phosphodiester glycosidase family protein [Brevibacillus sp. 179-C9.3 HS]|uniref:phosphodiester glycosidase family protein n=1 Tax=unclassified Brevibacillus TaxID=2684853 RepID=UPI00399F035D
MKVSKWLLAFCLFAACIIQPAYAAQSPQKEVVKSVQPGSQTFQTTSGKRTVQFVKINLNDTRLEVRPVLAHGELGKTQSLAAMAKQHNALAAMNGTFFMAYNKDAYKPPWGTIVIDYDKKNEGSSGASIGFNGNMRPVIASSAQMKEEQYEHVTSAGPTLVQNGKVVVNPLAEGMKDPKLVKLSGQRSFIGYTADNQLVMGTVPNVTLAQLATICQSMGLVSAMNMDGGASSGLYAHGKLLTTPGRDLSNALVVIERKAPSIQLRLGSTPLVLAQQPLLIQGSVYVPAQSFFTKLGISVSENVEEKSLTLPIGDKEYKIWESGKVSVNGHFLPMTERPRLISGKLMIPLRTAAELTSMNVEWDSKTRVATITDKGE